MINQKNIIWIIQSNQTTPIISAFLQTLQTRVEKYIDLTFWMPDTSSRDQEKLKDLNPFVYKTSIRTATQSQEAFQAKREALKKGSFSHGLKFCDVLLLDDLGGGNTQMTTIEQTPPENTWGMILQIPSTQGSSEIEEKNFHAAILWARQHKILVIGYELLPLDTQWTLAPSLPDGVITRYQESYDHLRTQLPHKNVWLLPSYESTIFTSVATSFHLNGAKASYHYRNQHKIPGDKTVLFLSHNVSMTYEYKRLIEILGPLGKDIHLMFGIGKDQIRGAYTHEQMIEIICGSELEKFTSYSFHDMNNPWEMMMADAIVACASGLSTMVGEKDLPCIIYDPRVPETIRGNKIRINTREGLLSQVNIQIEQHRQKMELADILMILASSGKSHV